MSKWVRLGFLMGALGAMGVTAGCDSTGAAAPGADMAVTPGNGDMAMAAADMAMAVADMAHGPDGLVTGDMATTFSVANAVLSASQETPPNESAATGTATFSVDAGKTMILVTLNVAGLNNISAAHIHVGKPGIAGPIIFPLSGGTFQSPLTKTLTAADFVAAGGIATFADAATAILNGQTYVNVHTMANPGGEIRGHIGPLTIKGVLSGGQETPPNTSTAMGTASLVLNAAQDSIAVTLDAGATANITAAHLHAGASGISGPVIFPLASQGFQSPYMKTLAAADFKVGGGLMTFNDAVAALLGGNVYVNVHTMANPGGEIRGQVGAVTLRSVLGPGQEPSMPTSTATGLAITTIDAEQTQIAVNLSHANLMNISAAHYHVGAVGVNGPVIFPLAAAPFASPLAKVLKAADLTPQAGQGINNFNDAINALLSGKSYVNIHTMANPGGEIRGQVGPVILKATLNGMGENPPVVTLGSGTATFAIDGAQRSITTTLNVTSLMNISASHIHIGPAMMNGPIIFGLVAGTFNSPLVKTLTVTDLTVQMAKGINTFSDAVNALLSSGQTYINVHTMANPGGEIRGQITP